MKLMKTIQQQWLLNMKMISVSMKIFRRYDLPVCGSIKVFHINQPLFQAIFFKATKLMGSFNKGSNVIINGLITTIGVELHDTGTG